METKNGEKVIEKEEEIANTFNNFFIEKILLHNSGIDQKHVKEPLSEKMEQKTRISARKL
jgi:hypothetical protein